MSERFEKEAIIITGLTFSIFTGIFLYIIHGYFSGYEFVLFPLTLFFSALSFYILLSRYFEFDIGVIEFHKMGSKVAPKWFDFLKWLLIIGVISYAEKSTGDSAIWIILYISYFLIFLYIAETVNHVSAPFFKIAKNKEKITGKIKILIILCLAIVISLYYFINMIVDRLTSGGPR